MREHKSDRDKTEMEAAQKWYNKSHQYSNAGSYLTGIDHFKSALKSEIEKEIEYIKAKHKDGYWGPSIPDYYRVEAEMKFLELIDTVLPNEEIK